MKYTYYNLRHTCLNLWRSIGITLDHLRNLIGHVDYATTAKHYEHEVPWFEVIRREVEELIEARHVERTAEGLIDGLGFVLARRWQAEGIEIKCAPPRSATPQIGHAAPLALSSNIIDLTPTASSIEIPAALGLATLNTVEIKKLQRARAIEMFSAGRTKPEIMKELGIALPTLSEWLRNADCNTEVRLGKLPTAEYQALKLRAQQLRTEQPELGTTAIAHIVGVPAKRVTDG